MKPKYYISYFVAILIFSCSAMAQEKAKIQSPVETVNINDTTRIKYKNPEDTEFWLCFQKNFRKDRNDTLVLELFISGNNDASVTIEIKGLNFVHNVFVPKGTVSNIKIPIEAEITSEEIIEKLAVHIVSDNPISVYGLNRRKQTTDTYLGLPVSVLGNQYRVMCYTLADKYMSQFAIIGIEDSTVVNINLTANSTLHPANFPYQVKLNKGEVYQVVANNERNSTCDLTGSLIQSDKNFAVFSGHQCANVTLNYSACNHLVEQMPPISSWGKHFYIGKQGPRTAYVYRVLANEPDTKVFEDAKLIATLNPGGFLEVETKKDVQITASKPVLVAQYSMGMSAYKDSIGDPMMIMVSPTQQFLKEYRFATPVNGDWHHYINLVVPTKALHSIRLNGVPIETGIFQEMGLSRYSIAYLEIPFGTHKITADLPFGLYSYGFGFKADNCDAYGTMGGQSFVEYENIPDTLAPMIDSKIFDDRIEIIARDDRINDVGLKRIEGILTENLKVDVPEFDEGIPQLKFKITPIDLSTGAKGIIRISDAAANLLTYSVCYYYDAQRDKFVLIFEQGNIPECTPKPPLKIGAYVGLVKDYTIMDKDKFLRENNGEFRHNPVINKTIGIYVGKQLLDSWIFSGTLEFTEHNGYTEIYGIIDSVRDIYSNRLLPHQNSKLLYAKGIFVQLNARAEYMWRYHLYGITGLSFTFSPNMSLEIMDNIIKPEDYVFNENDKKYKLDNNPEFSESNANKFSIGAILGAGYNLPVGKGFTLIGELLARVPVNSMLSTASWRIFSVNFNLGLKYNL